MVHLRSAAWPRCRDPQDISRPSTAEDLSAKAGQLELNAPAPVLAVDPDAWGSPVLKEVAVGNGKAPPPPFQRLQRRLPIFNPVCNERTKVSFRGPAWRSVRCSLTGSAGDVHVTPAVADVDL